MTAGPALAVRGAVLGTMSFGDSVSVGDAEAILDKYLASGGDHVDTANGYAGGASEEILGELLRRRDDDLFVASKVGIPHPDAGGVPPLSHEAIRASLEGSLRRLGRDRLDLYYLHQPDRDTPIAETLGALAELLAEGKIRHWGVSNYASWQVVELIGAADAIGLPVPAVGQQLYNALCRRLEDEYLEASAQHNTALIAYNPLAGGLLTGRHHYEDRPLGGRFGGERLGAMYTQRYWDRRMFDAVESLRHVAQMAGISLAELSLRWLKSKRGVHAVLVGGSRVSHVSDNLAALARGPLDEELVSAVDEVGNRLAGPMPRYNR